VVHDMFDIAAGSRLGVAFAIHLGKSFIKKIGFVPSNRIDRNTTGDFKDIVTTSIIKAADIKSFDYSDTVIRIFLNRKLKELKIKQPNGRNLAIEHSFRHIIKNKFKFEPTSDMDERIILHE